MIFFNVLRSLTKRLRSLEKLSVASQNFCVLLQRYLSSDKLFLFTLQLAVVTAHILTMERIIEFCFILGLNKVIVYTSSA